MRVLFVSPHPDDVEFFAGGTLLAHVAAGDAVSVLMLSRGEDGTSRRALKGSAIAEVRRAEAERRYALLPGVDVCWLNFVDGAIRHTPEAEAVLAAAVAARAPELVYYPAPRDTLFHHPDHRAAGTMAEAALGGAVGRAYHAKRPNRFVDVTPFAAEAHRALGFYRSQFALTASPPGLLRWGTGLRAIALRLWGLRAGTCLAEAFYEHGGHL